MKKRVFFIGAIAIASIVCATIYLNKPKNEETSEVNKQNESIEEEKEDNSNDLTESTRDSIPEDDNELVPEPGTEMPNIWIKNLDFLEDKIDYSLCLKLKTNVESQVWGQDRTAYEINLIEDTYKETETGFTIEAKVDVFKNNVLITCDGNRVRVKFFEKS